MAEVDQIAQGREAWERLQGRERKSWDDWILVARAIEIGRVSALKVAVSNRPVGTRYNRAMGAWLRGNGLGDIVAQERYKLLLILDNLRAITIWREGLPPAKRRRLNHPNAIWTHWRRSTAERRGATAAPRHVVIGKNGGKRKGDRPICWSQDHIRRAADALIEARSTDYFVMAKLSLEAAVRSRADLEALFEPPPRLGRDTKPAPAAAFAL
jgi:hypothetical protein